jgi:hypothetical protein
VNGDRIQAAKVLGISGICWPGCCCSRGSALRVEFVVPGRKCHFPGRTKEFKFFAPQQHDLPESMDFVEPNWQPLFLLIG